MSHPEQLAFIASIKQHFPDYFNNSTVLEVGSLNINGSVRQFFTNPIQYIGLDLGPGNGVDVICEGQNYKAPDNSFDVAVSAECFEHNPYWKETFLNMVRVVKTNGIVLITCATTGRAEHGTIESDTQSSPLTIAKGWNYYKNLTSKDFTEAIDMSSLFSSHQFLTNTKSFDLYFWGIVK